MNKSDLIQALATQTNMTKSQATRAVEIRFTRPPEPYRTIRIDLLEGIRTFDGAPIRPWMLTFSVGG